MRADLRHQKNFVAAALQALPHPVFGFTAMVFPTVVEESDAAIDRLLDNSNRSGHIGRIAEMVTTKAERRNTDVVAAERLHSNRIVVVAHSLLRRWLTAGWNRLDGQLRQKYAKKPNLACPRNYRPSIMAAAKAGSGTA